MSDNIKLMDVAQECREEAAKIEARGHRGYLWGTLMNAAADIDSLRGERSALVDEVERLRAELLTLAKFSTLVPWGLTRMDTLNAADIRDRILIADETAPHD